MPRRNVVVLFSHMVVRTFFRKALFTHKVTRIGNVFFATRWLSFKFWRFFNKIIIFFNFFDIFFISFLFRTPIFLLRFLAFIFFNWTNILIIVISKFLGFIKNRNRFATDLIRSNWMWPIYSLFHKSVGTKK